MRPFSYQAAADADQAVRAASVTGAAFLAGGTGLLDLMKLDVMRPQLLAEVVTQRGRSCDADTLDGCKILDRNADSGNLILERQANWGMSAFAGTHDEYSFRPEQRCD